MTIHEIVGDLWEKHAAGAVIAITIGGMVKNSGKSIMLRGCAHQAADRFPELIRIHGSLLINHGNHVFDLGRRIVSSPVEAGPYQNPDLRVIERSCRKLVELTDDREWPQVVVPRSRYGGGGLVWQEVRPILVNHFDGRFYHITRE